MISWTLFLHIGQIWCLASNLNLSPHGLQRIWWPHGYITVFRLASMQMAHSNSSTPSIFRTSTICSCSAKDWSLPILITSSATLDIDFLGNYLAFSAALFASYSYFFLSTSGWTPPLSTICLASTSLSIIMASQQEYMPMINSDSIGRDVIKRITVVFRAWTSPYWSSPYYALFMSLFWAPTRA